MRKPSSYLTIFEPDAEAKSSRDSFEPGGKKEESHMAVFQRGKDTRRSAESHANCRTSEKCLEALKGIIRNATNHA